ncbi:MAG: four-carbon acid sugar kinase family protein [Sphaerobacteraceae bacterium]|nr:MAG: four-carbon acid sugar kinase family protein [Sphaerobacteraceae bacterium]
MHAQQLRLTWYGDDFTGSTDAMEALTLAGIPAALFLDVPKPAELAQLSGVEAIGIAGNTRAMDPVSIERTLLPVLEGLKALNAPICHYKLCSTFDSSPEIGSIGRAIELGRRVFGEHPVPLLVGAPALGRYSLFGNLFARSGRESEVFRLDRHPTMQHHPVTPMDESDLRNHLAPQTDLKVGLFDIVSIRSDDARERLIAMVHEDKPDIVLFDILEDSDLPRIGQMIEAMRPAGTRQFAAGSSGIEYALTAWWSENGELSDTESAFSIDHVEQTVVVSGSCSPVTARQIEHACNNGFVQIPLQPERLLSEESKAGEIERAVEAARQAMSGGESVILHSCFGPEDPRRSAVATMLETQGWTPLDIRLRSGEILGNALGTILREVLDSTSLPRVMVAGGDTSYHVAKALGIRSLTMVAPTAPGSPLCRASAPGSPIDGSEIVFKGGQVGSIGFFDSVRAGSFA